MIRIAFYSDDNGIYTGIWDQLRRAYNVAEIYEIGGDPANANPGSGWYVVAAAEDVPGHKVAFSPLGVRSPGSLSIDLLQLEGDETLIFGANQSNNVFGAELVVFIDTPGKGSLYNFQAAAIALHSLLGGDRG